MKMIGSGTMGQRRRYLAEQAAFMEETFGKAFTTPITKPVASFKAPAAAGAAPKPKAGGLKPTGNALPSASQRLTALRQNLASSGPSSTPPAAAGGATASVGKADKLRRKGKFQRTRSSSVVKGITLGPAVRMQSRLLSGASKTQPGVLLAKNPSKVTKLRRTGKGLLSSKINQLGMEMPAFGRPLEAMTKREPLKTSISEDDARKLVDRHGLKGPLPKELNRDQRMAAYEARYVSAGGKKAERWDRRARTADKVKTGGLAVATAGGAGWLATRGRLKTKPLSPKVRSAADTVAVAGATAGGAGELYAGHARRKRSSYASAPAGVAASALRRMQDYSKD